MSPLNIHPEENVDTSKKKKSNKMLKVLLGIGVLVLVPVIGSTLAANISINSDADVQFAQGQQATTGCDQTITISATSDYSSGAYVLGTVTLSEFDFTDCTGKTIILSAANSGGSEVGLTNSPIDRAEILIGATSATCNTGFTCAKVTGESKITVNVDLDTYTPAPSTSIYKFLLQSID
jgi:hypothetical protein